MGLIRYSLAFLDSCRSADDSDIMRSANLLHAFCFYETLRSPHGVVYALGDMLVTSGDLGSSQSQNVGILRKGALCHHSVLGMTQMRRMKGSSMLMSQIAPTPSVTRSADPTNSMPALERVLVVEDDPSVQRALKHLFEIEGYAVEIHGNGQSALESFHAFPPAIIVLDLRLPRLSGRDLCKEVKAESPTLPIVVLSAASDVSDKVVLLELGADDYVTKPFSPRELLARVARRTPSYFKNIKYQPGSVR